MCEANPTFTTMVTWTRENDQVILLWLLRHASKIDYDEIAKLLNCTRRAVEERIKKLKKMEAGDQQAQTSPCSAPSSLKRKKVKQEKIEEVDEDESEFSPSPTPTPKRRGSRNKQSVEYLEPEYIQKFFEAE